MVRVIAGGNVYPQDNYHYCCWPKCKADSVDRGFPLCEHHYRKVGVDWMFNEGPGFFSGRRPQADPNAKTLEEHRAEQAERMAAQSQVYYIRIGDHVKIGYSINMRQRLGALRVDDDALLATEPGGRSLEAQRHREFADERVSRRENFNPSRRLLAHIEAVKAKHGPPRITDYKTDETARTA